ncbi:MAG: helix-turn-helix domain-containing protein [Acidobacteria bacterium]|nr:helix-turn-helix domain-containing protein [Acidobacteriota bacterium]
MLLEDISAATRVGVRYLESLESDDFRALPGGVFNRGIVRGYARCVCMDEQEAVDSFLAACRRAGVGDEGDQNWGEFAQNVSRQRADTYQRRIRWAGVAAMVLTILIAGAFVVSILMKRGVVSVPHFHNSGNTKSM